MSITVQVIFIGLIGFAPNLGGQKGMTALMVDPDLVGKPPVHTPVVLLLRGECESRNPHHDDCEKDMDSELHWTLIYEDVEIFGQQKSMDFGKKRKRHKDMPSSKDQAKDFSWVPSIDLLTGGHGQVRQEFLKDGWPKTPVSARFTVRGGQASSCHLIHRPEKYPDPRQPEREVILFHYDNVVNYASYQQAVADAVKVEFQVEGKFASLYAWNFTEEGQESLSRKVKLYPEKGLITLVVANLPEQDGQAHSGGSHFDIFFDLLARQPPFRPTRSATDITETMDPGSCEEEFDTIQKRFSPSTDPALKTLAEITHPTAAPHSRTFCDGMSYP